MRVSLLLLFVSLIVPAVFAAARITVTQTLSGLARQEVTPIEWRNTLTPANTPSNPASVPAGTTKFLAITHFFDKDDGTIYYRAQASSAVKITNSGNVALSLTSLDVSVNGSPYASYTYSPAISLAPSAFYIEQVAWSDTYASQGSLPSSVSFYADATALDGSNPVTDDNTKSSSLPSVTEVSQYATGTLTVTTSLPTGMSAPNVVYNIPSGTTLYFSGISVTNTNVCGQQVDAIVTGTIRYSDGTLLSANSTTIPILTGSC